MKTYIKKRKSYYSNDFKLNAINIVKYYDNLPVKNDQEPESNFETKNSCYINNFSIFPVSPQKL